MQQGRIKDFVNYLFNNPNVGSGSPLSAESVVLQFLRTNIKQLEMVFRQPNFFPDTKTNDVLSLLVQEIKERTVSAVLPVLNKEIDKIDFSFLVGMDKTGSFTAEMYKTYFKNYLARLLSSPEARMNLAPVYNILTGKILDKYIHEIFTKRTPTYFELVRVQKNNLPFLEYLNYMKAVLFIRPFAYYRSRLEGVSDSEVNISDYISTQSNLDRFLEAKTRSTYQALPGVSPKLVLMSFKSHLHSSYLQPEDATAKFLYIMCTRYFNYQEMKKIDRGAESPDKSFFSISRKNSAHNGFDKRILEDLYMIAGNNGW